MDADLKANGIDHTSATAKQIDASMAMGFILGSNRVRFGKLIKDLENQHTQGIKSVPQILTEAFVLLNNWKNNTKNQKIILGDSVAFTNKGGKGTTKQIPSEARNTSHASNAMKQATTQMNAQMQQKLINNGNDDENAEDYEHDEEDNNNNCNFANILCKQSPSVVSKTLDPAW